MSTTRGCFGQITVDASVVGELRSWELTETAEEIDVSAMGNCVKKYESGPVEASGTMAVWLDDADAGQALLAVATEVDVILWPGGAGSGLAQRSFTARINEIPESADVEGAVERSYTYRATTAIDRTPQT